MRNILLILLVALMMVITIQNVYALQSEESYVFLSDNYFLVFELDEDKNVHVIDGGVFYDSEWRLIDVDNLIINQVEENSNIVWVEGKLSDSNLQFWFNWNLLINSDVVTGFWVYDGEVLTEYSDHTTFMEKLFY